MKKKILGIRIKYPVTEGKDFLRAQFFIERGTPSETFISSSLIRNAIRVFRKKKQVNPEGKKLGYADLVFFYHGSRVFLSVYQPIRLDEEIFSGKEIADRLELILLRKMQKRFPHAELIESYSPSKWRKIQTARRKVKGIQLNNKIVLHRFGETVSALRKNLTLANRKRKH